jgi:two-component system OmpR family response regulator
MPPHILVVDDDPEIRTLLGRYLSEQGFRVSLAASGAESRRQLAAQVIDLVVLDILLPDGTGLELCRHMRAQKNPVPVILLTALKEDVDRIIGLEIGADDYMGKPFNPRELVARIRTVLRRSDPGAHNQTRKVYRFAGFHVDAHSRTVIAASQARVDVTPAEFDLLIVFLEHPGRVLSRDQLLDFTQGRGSEPFDRSIDVLVSRLRRKLDDHGNHQLFKTIRNGGYLLSARVENSEGE